MSAASHRKVVLLDGSALAYRSHFAFIRNPLINSKGLNTSACYGFLSKVLEVLDKQQPQLFVVTFDTSRQTFRHELYGEYKATREKMPDEMRAQIPIIFDLIKALGLPLVTQDGFEADDVLGTLAEQARAQGDDVLIVSADKDLLQLVGPGIKVFNPWAAKGQPDMLDAKGVEQKMGVPPEKVIDLLALMGDSSDNVPGVPGIGEKTALKLLTDFGSLDALLASPEKVTAKRAREGLEKGRALAELSKKLVTIRRDVPLEHPLSSLSIGERDNKALRELCQSLEFAELQRRFVEGIETAEVHYDLIETEKQLHALIKQLRAAGRFVIDLETTSLDVFDAEILGLAFSFEEGKAVYVPTRRGSAGPQPGQTGDLFAALNKGDNGFLDQLKPLIEDPSLAKGGQNLKYDMMVLASHGIVLQGFSFDTLLESYVIDPASRTHNIDDLALRYLSYRKIKTRDLIGSGAKKINMSEVPVAEVARYAAEDADICLRLHRIFSERLAAEPKLQELYDTLEKPLLPVLMRMEQRGIKVDAKVLAGLKGEFEAKAQELLKKAHEIAGSEFNPGSPKQLREVLYDRLEVHKLTKVRPKQTGGGELSTDVSVLERMAEKHPLPQIILDYRAMTKLIGTYVDALPKLIKPKTGRVHTSFNQAVAATGRLSSSDPNLQNIPIRSPEGMRIRGAFIAGEPGWSLLSADYSQVELRLLAHLSGEEALIEAFAQGADIHRATAARVFKVKAEDVTAEQRGKAKAINFGIIYGMGAPRLAAQTSTTVKEAQAFIESYFETYPKVRGYLDEQIALAEQQGYVETILGRRREIPEIREANQQMRGNAERIATNTPIQGSAADLIKLAMIRIDARLQAEKHPARMLLQVHDELIFEAPDEHLDSLEKLVRAEMEGVWELKVPLLVELGRGRSWLEAH
jgi:DNA polymerase-1